SAILQARLFEPATATLRGVIIWELDADQQPTARLQAESATPRSGGWLLHQVNVKRLTAGRVSQLADYRDLPVSLDLSISDLKVVEKSADNMGFLDLARYCGKLERGGYDTTRYRALLHSKLSIPFAALIMAFLGIPFALRSGRSGGIAIGVGLSLGIGFCYFVVNATLLSFGKGGALPPIVAAWAANFVFAALGSWLVLTVDS
ncbi:MAG TPA: LptF/LptG family permease, partial [Geobacteraceae bacterium]